MYLNTLIGTVWDDAVSTRYILLDERELALKEWLLSKEQLLLIFFDSDYPFCAAETELWSHLEAEKWGKSIAIVGVVDLSTRDSTAEFLLRQRLAFPVILDRDWNLHTRARVDVWPTKVLVSNEFQVILVFQGVSTRLSFDEELGALPAALGIPPNDLPKSPRGGTDVVA